jgi:hypothetical protein
MKLKNRDWTDVERRLGATGSRLLQEDRRVRAALLAIAVFGVVILVGIVIYLIHLSTPLQDNDPGVSAMRSWRSL